MLQWTPFTNPHVSLVKFRACLAKINALALKYSEKMESENHTQDLLTFGEKKTTRVIKTIIFIQANKCKRSFFRNKRIFKIWKLWLSLLLIYKAGLLLRWSLLCVNIQHIFTEFSSAPGKRCRALPWGFLQLCISPSSMQWAEGPSVQRSIAQLFLNSWLLTAFSLHLLHSFTRQKKKEMHIFEFVPWKKDIENAFFRIHLQPHTYPRIFSSWGVSLCLRWSVFLLFYSPFSEPHKLESHWSFELQAVGENPNKLS